MEFDKFFVEYCNTPTSIVEYRRWLEDLRCELNNELSKFIGTSNTIERRVEMYQVIDNIADKYKIYSGSDFNVYKVFEINIKR